MKLPKKNEKEQKIKTQYDKHLKWWMEMVDGWTYELFSLFTIEF